MQEFQKLLKNNKDLPSKGEDGKVTPGKFELHKVERDSTGQERYIKTKEDDAIQKAKITEMGQKAAQELQGASYEERWKWIEDVKAQGNEMFKEKKYAESIDKYT